MENNFINVYVIDPDTFDCLDVIDIYSSLTWTDNYYECGAFEIDLPAVEKTINLFTVGKYLYIKESEKFMIVEKINIEDNKEGSDTIKVAGRSLESILDRRVVQKKYDSPGTEIPLQYPSIVTAIGDVSRSAYVKTGTASGGESLEDLTVDDDEYSFVHLGSFSLGDTLYFYDTKTDFDITENLIEYFSGYIYSYQQYNSQTTYQQGDIVKSYWTPKGSNSPELRAFVCKGACYNVSPPTAYIPLSSAQSGVDHSYGYFNASWSMLHPYINKGYTSSSTFSPMDNVLNGYRLYSKKEFVNKPVDLKINYDDLHDNKKQVYIDPYSEIVMNYQNQNAVFQNILETVKIVNVSDYKRYAMDGYSDIDFKKDEIYNHYHRNNNWAHRIDSTELNGQDLLSIPLGSLFYVNMRPPTHSYETTYRMFLGVDVSDITSTTLRKLSAGSSSSYFKLIYNKLDSNDLFDNGFDLFVFNQTGSRHKLIKYVSDIKYNELNSIEKHCIIKGFYNSVNHNFYEDVNKTILITPTHNKYYYDISGDACYRYDSTSIDGYVLQSYTIDDFAPTYFIFASKNTFNDPYSQESELNAAIKRVSIETNSLSMDDGYEGYDWTYSNQSDGKIKLKMRLSYDDYENLSSVDAKLPNAYPSTTKVLPLDINIKSIIANYNSEYSYLFQINGNISCNTDNILYKRPTIDNDYLIGTKQNKSSIEALVYEFTELYPNNNIIFDKSHGYENLNCFTGGKRIGTNGIVSGTNWWVSTRIPINEGDEIIFKSTQTLSGRKIRLLYNNLDYSGVTYNTVMPTSSGENVFIIPNAPSGSGPFKYMIIDGKTTGGTTAAAIGESLKYISIKKANISSGDDLNYNLSIGLNPDVTSQTFGNYCLITIELSINVFEPVQRETLAYTNGIYKDNQMKNDIINFDKIIINNVEPSSAREHIITNKNKIEWKQNSSGQSGLRLKLGITLDELTGGMLNAGSDYIFNKTDYSTNIATYFELVSGTTANEIYTRYQYGTSYPVTSEMLEKEVVLVCNNYNQSMRNQDGSYAADRSYIMMTVTNGTAKNFNGSAYILGTYNAVNDSNIIDQNEKYSTKYMLKYFTSGDLIYFKSENKENIPTNIYFIKKNTSDIKEDYAHKLDEFHPNAISISDMYINPNKEYDAETNPNLSYDTDSNVITAYSDAQYRYIITPTLGAKYRDNNNISEIYTYKTDPNSGAQRYIKNDTADTSNEYNKLTTDIFNNLVRKKSDSSNFYETLVTGEKIYESEPDGILSKDYTVGYMVPLDVGYCEVVFSSPASIEKRKINVGGNTKSYIANVSDLKVYQYITNYEANKLVGFGSDTVGSEPSAVMYRTNLIMPLPTKDNYGRNVRKVTIPQANIYWTYNFHGNVVTTTQSVIGYNDYITYNVKIINGGTSSQIGGDSIVSMCNKLITQNAIEPQTDTFGTSSIPVTIIDKKILFGLDLLVAHPIYSHEREGYKKENYIPFNCLKKGEQNHPGASAEEEDGINSDLNFCYAYFKVKPGKKYIIAYELDSKDLVKESFYTGNIFVYKHEPNVVTSMLPIYFWKMITPIMSSDGSSLAYNSPVYKDDDGSITVNVGNFLRTRFVIEVPDLSNNTSIEGFYSGTNFYTDYAMQHIITPISGNYYKDLKTDNIYRYTGGNYVLQTDPVEDLYIVLNFLNLSKSQLEAKSFKAYDYVWNERIIPNLSIKKDFEYDPTDPALSVTVDSKFHGDNLYDAITNVTKSNYTGCKIDVDSKDKTLRFYLYKGKDRRLTQSANTPVLLSEAFGDVLSGTYTHSTEKCKNTCVYIGLEASFAGVSLATMGYSTYGNGYDDNNIPSGLNRREVGIDMDKISALKSIFSSGESMIKKTLKQKTTETLRDAKEEKLYDGQIDKVNAYEYGRDYNLGDIIQIEYSYNKKDAVRVTSYTITSDENGIKKKPGFSVLEDFEDQT